MSKVVEPFDLAFAVAARSFIGVERALLAALVPLTHPVTKVVHLAPRALPVRRCTTIYPDLRPDLCLSWQSSDGQSSSCQSGYKPACNRRSRARRRRAVA